MHFYTYNKVLSYNIPVNVIIAQRGIGKSYGAKDFVISQFLKRQSQFLYLRRYENELKEVFETKDGSKTDFFNDIAPKYNSHILQAKNRKFYIDKQCFGIAKRITEAQDLKSSSSFENIKTILIDEYGIEKNNHRFYLPNEGMILLGIFDSILRNRDDVRIFILSNAVDGIEYSPLFSFFGLTLPYNNEIKLFKENTILVQYVFNEDFIKDRQQTLIGKLAKGTAYEQYAINNKILSNNNNFIEKKEGTAKFGFTFIFKDNKYGVWFDYKLGKIYVSNDYLKDYPFTFACTLSDHSPNTMLISTFKKYSVWKTFIENFKMGNVRFENMKIKYNVQELMKIILTR